MANEILDLASSVDSLIQRQRSNALPTARPLVWLVGYDCQVDVWIALERRARLFAALLEHLSHDLAETYQGIKDKFRDAITEMMESQAARISVTGLTSLVFALAEKLDVVLDSRVLGGNCDVCRRIAAADGI